MRYLPVLILVVLVTAAEAYPAEYHVDPEQGDDAAAGSAEAPFRTLARTVNAVRKTGGTLHLAEGAVFKQPIDLRGNVAGAIVIEGNGAVIDLGTDVSDGPWIEDGDGFILDRDLPRTPNNAPWQMATLHIDGKPVTAVDPRRQKAGGPGEVEHLEDGRMRVVFPDGTSPGESAVIAHADYPQSAVALGSDDVTIRDLHARFAGNDGFNIHGSGKNIRLEGVTASYNGDEGISVHGDCEASVTDAVIARNASAAGGVADVGRSVTRYTRCVSTENRGAGFYFSGKQHTLTDCVVAGNRRLVSAGQTDGLVQQNLIEIDTIHASLPPTADPALTAVVERARELLAEPAGSKPPSDEP